MMPAGAAESRGKQKSVLAGVVYEKVLPFPMVSPLLAFSGCTDKRKTVKQAPSSSPTTPAGHSVCYSLSSSPKRTLAEIVT